MIVSDSIIAQSKDSTITLIIDKTDAFLLRRYITDLEYRSASYDLSQDKLTLLEKKSIIWEQTADNYKEQRDLANLALINQIELQDNINVEMQNEIKLSYKKGSKKGFKRGAIVASATTLLICLLVK